MKAEESCLDDLKRNYKLALQDINRKIRILQSDELTQSRIYQLEYQKALKKQIEAILNNLQSKNYDTISGYLKESYENGYIGTMYSLHNQGMPFILPIDQQSVVKAIIEDTRLSESLYDSLDMDVLKKDIRSEISIGFATNASYDEIARNIAFKADMNYKQAKRIAVTEAHRVQETASFDAGMKAKAEGADLVKQWDSYLDGRTRETHRLLDGQIREMNKPFEVAGKKAMFPSDFGDPSEDCNCRCVLLNRARAALDKDELKVLKERASFHELYVRNKTKYRKVKEISFSDFRIKYLEASKTIEKIWENGIIQVGETVHASERMEQRTVNKDDILDALQNPLFIGEEIEDEYGRKSVRIIGKDATVCVNPETGTIITTWKTSSKIRKKLESGE